jgi:hypothetical protein
MKLRVLPNAIRLRLGKSEVERLGQGEECREAIRFPGSQLEYVLGPSSGDAIDASFSGSQILINVPQAQLKSWCASNQVGLSKDIAIPDGVLQVLIEKDFRCLDAHDGPDQADTFENPQGAHARCEPAK